MSTGPNADIAAKQPARRKRGEQPGNTNNYKLSGHTQRVLSLKERSSTEQSSTFIKHLSLVLEEIPNENALHEC